MGRLPDFFILGKAKSGTTALYAALNAHPAVFMSYPKEPCFFVCEDGPVYYRGDLHIAGISDLHEYRGLFAGATTETAVGEASPQYLFPDLAPRAAAAIQRHVPQARLVAIIRHPAEYVHSYYHFSRSLDSDPAPSVEQALAEEKAGARAGMHPGLRLLESSGSYDPLRAYYERFAAGQIRVYLYEEWRQQPAQVLADLFTFLGVEPVDPAARLEQPARIGVTGYARIPYLRWLMGKSHPLMQLVRKFVPAHWRKPLAQRVRSWNRTAPPPLPSATRQMIVAAMREDILKTQDLIGKDLTHWLT
ncbi:MAG: sulfotransferase [Litorilinea sp.]